MIVSLSDLKNYLWICDDSQDRLLGLFLDSAESTVLSYIGRDIVAKDYTEIRDGNWQKEFTMKNYPINTITSISLNTWTYDNKVWTVIDDVEYTFDGNVWQIYFRNNLYRDFQNYKILYNAWYNPAPADIKIAVLKLASSYYNSRTSDGIKGETVNGDRIDFDTSSIPDNIITILQTYRDM